MTHQITIEQRLIEHKGNSTDRDNLALAKIRTQQDEITRLRAELAECRACNLDALDEAQEALERAEAAEAREAKLRSIAIPDDMRPCLTDTFLLVVLHEFDDKWDFWEAIKSWTEGDWKSAMYGIPEGIICKMREEYARLRAALSEKGGSEMSDTCEDFDYLRGEVEVWNEAIETMCAKAESEGFLSVEQIRALKKETNQ